MANLQMHLVDSQIDPSKMEARLKNAAGVTASRGFLEVNEGQQAAELLKAEGGE